MAELVGVLSAGTGIASFLFQVGIGIETIRKTISYNRHQASVDLESIAADFEKLQKVIKDIRDSQNHALIALAIERCRQMFTEVEDDLCKLSQIFGHNKSPKSRLKSIKTQLMSKAEDNVKNMRSKVQQIMETLLLASILLNQLEISQGQHRKPVSPETSDSRPAIEHTQTRDTSVTKSPCLGNRSMARGGRPGIRAAGACSHKQMSYISRRFWWLELTPIRGLWHKCSTCCSTGCQWAAKLRLALTWINIPYAVTASFAFTFDNGQYALRPALAIQHVVKNTSPGFEALFMCETFNISVEECKHRLRDIYQSDAYFKHHVNPAGKSYLRHLVKHPWDSQSHQFELLDFFLSELSMDFTTEDPGLLIDCSHWIGEGWHLHLLTTILNHGFAPIALDPPATDRWPQPCNIDWLCESITPDPFFLDYFALIVSHEPQFAGVTDIQALILAGTSFPRLDPELANQRERLLMVNFLRQSSLHLAVGNIKIVTMLLDFGHDLDLTDNWGMTPLMYAAAMGFEEVAVHLLLNGANPWLQDTRFDRTFLDYAIVRGQWNLIHKTLSALQDLYQPEDYQMFVTLVLIRSMSSRIFSVTEDIRRQHVSKVIQLCDGVNFSVNDAFLPATGNNLMHYAETVEEAEALVCRGFDSFNQPNSDGRLAIHSKMHNKEMFSYCVDHGTDINHVDTKGQTLLFMLLSSLEKSTGNAKCAVTFQQIQCCLHRGADHRHSDDCKCPCSPEGCSSSALFEIKFREMWSFQDRRPDILWAFEWQSILREVLGEEAVKEFLLSLIRRIEFDELGMTHVCCHRGEGIPFRSDLGIFQPYPKAMDEQDMDDILKEEDDFIDILDQTMRELALKSVKDLQRQLLGMIKTRYDEHLERFAEETTRNSRQITVALERFPSWKIDHKNDEFVQNCQVTSSSLLMKYCMPRSLAEHILLLDLEFFRTNDSVAEITERNAGYLWRIGWVKEVIGIFKLFTDDIATYLDRDISQAGLDLDKHIGEQIKHRFVAFCRTVDS